MRISEIFEYYLAGNKKNEKYKGFFVPVLNFFGNVELEKISKNQVSKFLTVSGLKMSSQKVRIAYAAVAVNFAKKNGFIENVKNPFIYNFNKQELFRMRTERKDMNADYEELSKFIEFVQNPTVHNICKLALNTGIRCEEVCKLQWRHITNNGIRFTSDETKEQRCRTIPLLFESKSLLQNMKHKTTKNQNTSFVFLQKDGKPYIPNNLSRQVSFCFTKFKEKYPEAKQITFQTLYNAFAQTCQLTGTMSKEALVKCCC